MPIISIIVPIYNISEFHLRQCIESLIDNEHKYIEIILVDDGCPDTCGLICDEYSILDNRIIVIHQKNQGASIARNAGIQYASGKWLLFIDADDWVESDYIDIITPYINDVFDVIYFGFYENDSEKKTYIELQEKIGSLSKYEFIESLFYSGKYGQYVECFSTPWSKLFKAEYVNKYNLLFERGIIKNQDTLFAFDICLQNCFRTYVPVEFYHHRVHSNSVGTKFNSDLIASSDKLTNCVNQRLASADNDFNVRSITEICAIFSLLHSEMQTYFFHSNNPKSYIDRRCEFIQRIKTEPINSAIRNCKLSKYESRSKVLLVLTRIHCFLLLEWAFKLRHWYRFLLKK